VRLQKEFGLILRLVARWHRASAALFLFGCTAVTSFGPCTSQAAAQTIPETRLQRQLDRVDLGLQGVGEYTGTVSGTTKLINPSTNAGYSLTEDPSTTFGFLGTLRYTYSPFRGAEFNYGYARYTENFSSFIVGGAQTTASEYSVGYVAHSPRQFFGVTPYASAGIGTIDFKPTRYGGQGLPEQARMEYYYNVGVETPLFTNWLGLRVGFRQQFFLAPDFQTNYLTILKRTTTSEPMVGFTAHF
jgi:hypothetical protein